MPQNSRNRKEASHSSKYKIWYTSEALWQRDCSACCIEEDPGDLKGKEVEPKETIGFSRSRQAKVEYRIPRAELPVSVIRQRQHRRCRGLPSRFFTHIIQLNDCRRGALVLSVRGIRGVTEIECDVDRDLTAKGVNRYYIGIEHAKGKRKRCFEISTKMKRKT